MKAEVAEISLATKYAILQINVFRALVVAARYPLSVSNRKAVVKYMFHKPEDVRWFKVRLGGCLKWFKKC